MKTSKSALTNADRSYSSDADFDGAYDPASGHIVSSDRRRHDDLKQMLDSNKDQLKLDAMRRIISLVARGRDFSDLYATVVKNVVSKNCEIRKLVCLYLMRYAEDHPDLALLPISTLQKAFKEPNQFVRADSVSTLSSIRVPLISQIILITITDAIVDLSPLVRKMAAIAITKIYNLGVAKKEDLEPLLGKLLCDHSLLVLNSAILAFNEVCPHRLDLFHCKFKFMCRNLLDLDQWAQAVFLQIFTRYARDQFLDTNGAQKNIEDEQLSECQKTVRKAMESDFQLLLAAARPLIYSDNYAVSLAYVQFYYYCGTATDIQLLVKPILRALDAHAEIKQLFLDVTVEVSSKNKELFEPYIRHFFVQANDIVQTKRLKLVIMTNLLNETNQFVVLRELQSYLSPDDAPITQSVIQAIGRCAAFSHSLREICVQGLVKLLAHKNETILSETVLVLHDLFRSFGIHSNEIVIRMTQLFPVIPTAAARAAILSLFNQYFANIFDSCPRFPFMAAKNFANEEYVVKLQIINLVEKLYASKVEHSDFLFDYVKSMANYDPDYDIRDKMRARFSTVRIEELLDVLDAENSLPSNHSPVELERDQDANKRCSVLTEDCANLQFGTMSYYFKEKLHYCHTVPEFRTDIPDIDPRYVKESAEDVEYALIKNLKFTNEKKATSNESTDENISSEKTVQVMKENAKAKQAKTDDDENSKAKSSDSESSSESSDSVSSSSSSGGSLLSEPESSEAESQSKKTTEMASENANTKRGTQSNIDLLLELTGCGNGEDALGSISSSKMLPLAANVVTRFETGAGAGAGDVHTFAIVPVNPAYVSYEEISLLDAARGNGLQITYRFTRSQNLSSVSMVSIGLTFANTIEKDICNIQICRKYIKAGMMFHDFTPISLLKRSSPQSGTIAIDFSDSIQIATFEISTSVGSFTVSITPKMGELLRPVSMTDATFQVERNRLCGLQELSENVSVENVPDNIDVLVLKAANLAIHQSDSESNRYCGVTASARTLLLLTIIRQSNQLKITINSEKMTVASILLTELKQTFNATSAK